MHYNFLYMLHISLFNLIFMHLDVLIHTTHKRTSTKDWLQDDMPWGVQPAVPEPRAAPWGSKHGSRGGLQATQALAVRGQKPARLPRPNLPCCPGIQLHAQLSPNLAHRSEMLEEDTAAANPRACPSSSPALQVSCNGSPGYQFCTNLGMQLAGLRMGSTHVIYYTAAAFL